MKNWDDALEFLRERLKNKSKATQRNYFYFCNQFRAWVSKPLDQVTEEDCQAFADGAATPASQNQRATAVSFFFNQVLNNHLSIKKLTRIKIDVTKKNYTRRTINAVIRRTEYPQQAAICLMYGCGLKIGEVLELKRKDITKEFIKVKGRKIPTPKNYWTYIQNHLNEHKEDRVFISDCYGRNGKLKPLCRTTIQKHLEIKPHDLRHQFAKDHVKNGASLQDIQYLLGLTSAESALRYFKHKPKPALLTSPADL